MPRRAKAKKPATRKKTGRPSSFTQKTADLICNEMASGKTLRAVCREQKIEQRTVFRWLADDERVAFRQQYARAREQMAEAMFDEALAIADHDSTDRGQIERDRLRIDQRRWMLGKIQPKKYGDRVAVEHGDSDGNPIRPTIVLLGRPEPEPRALLEITPKAVGGPGVAGNGDAVRRGNGRREVVPDEGGSDPVGGVH